MIDTTKFYCIVSEEVKNKIQRGLDLATKYNEDSGEIYYKYSSGSVEGSYSSTMNISVEDTATKYNLFGCLLVVEGSFHKWSKGYNSHNGFYNLKYILSNIIRALEHEYDVKLPRFFDWYIQRVDISICYDIQDQDNVKSYINNMSYMTYPRRKTRFYCNESLYFSGTSTTLKIYNKQAEFIKHDLKRFRNSDFDIVSYLDNIKGYIRYECEIKKKKLSDIYGCKNIKAYTVEYKDLFNLWKEEFMKLYKLNENGIGIVRDSNEVKNRLYSKYGNTKGHNLYGFYLSIIHEGYKNVLLDTASSTFYRKISELKNAGIDFSQGSFVVEDFNFNERFINFNPFDDMYREVV